MKPIVRKSPMVRAIDLRDRRRRAGMTASEFADVLEIVDAKQVSAMEIGACAITLEKAIRAAYKLGGVVVQLEGFGYAVVAPLKDFTPDTEAHVAEDPGMLRAGEAAWISLKENKEAMEAISGLQAAVLEGNRASLVTLYDELVCDTTQANDLLAKAIQEIDPTIKDEAEARHAQHNIAGKAKQRVLGPMSAVAI